MIQTSEKRSRIHPRPERRRFRQFLAWCVHAYTALGLVAAAGIALLVVQGGPESFRWAFILMLAATLIDATDGTLARKVRVKEVLPGFDGRRLDDIVDFLTYTTLPLFLLWQVGDPIVPRGFSWILLAPLLSSAYGFCQVSVKTDDGYFLGFPSYWNLVAFYLYMLQPPAWFSVTAIFGFSFLTFVPFRYLYPSQQGRLNRLTNLLGAIWAVLIVWILWTMPAEAPSAIGPVRNLTLISLFFPVYYLVASWFVSLRIWRSRLISKGS